MFIKIKRCLYIIFASLLSFTVAFAQQHDQFFKEIDLLGGVIGLENSEVIKGYAYENGDTKQGIQANPKKAIEAFYQAFKSGNPVGAYKVGFFYWGLESLDASERKKKLNEFKSITDGITNADYFFEKGSQMNSQERYKEIATLLAVTHGIYLFLHDEGEKSIKVLTQSKEIQSRAEAQLYLAFNYLKMKDMKMADFFLSKTCNNPKANREIRAFCSSDNVTSIKK